MTPTTSAFARRVLQLVSRIPPGRVTTYGDLARLAGHAGAARAVGAVVRTASRRGLPYHRVIAAGGRLGGYGGRTELKRALLVAEGLVVQRDRVRDFERYRWPAASKHRGSNARRQTAV